MYLASLPPITIDFLHYHPRESPVVAICFPRFRSMPNLSINASQLSVDYGNIPDRKTLKEESLNLAFTSRACPPLSSISSGCGEAEHHGVGPGCLPHGDQEPPGELRGGTGIKRYSSWKRPLPHSVLLLPTGLHLKLLLPPNSSL